MPEGAAGSTAAAVKSYLQTSALRELGRAKSWRLPGSRGTSLQNVRQSRRHIVCGVWVMHRPAGAHMLLTLLCGSDVMRCSSKS